MGSWNGFASQDVNNGTETLVAWNGMIHLPPGAEKDTLIKDLLTYCGQDTMAMVAIHKDLR